VLRVVRELRVPLEALELPVQPEIRVTLARLDRQGRRVTSITVTTASSAIRW
jgi:hypothetical protein